MITLIKPWYIDYIDETLMGYFVSTTEADLLKDDAMQAENYYLEPTTERDLQDLNQYMWTILKLEYWQTTIQG